MKKLYSLFGTLILTALIMVPAMRAFAQDATPTPAAVVDAVSTVPTQAEWTNLLGQLTTLPGATTAAICVVVVQLLLLCSRQFLNLQKDAAFWAVCVLSLLTAIGAEIVKAPKLDLSVVVSVLASAPSLAAINVFLHQISKRTLKKAA